MTDLIESECCVDCALFLAIGEESKPPRGPLIHVRWEASRLHLTESTNPFSWDPCSACGDKAGGQRFGFRAN